MQEKVKTMDDYFNSLSDDRKETMKQLRKTVQKNLPGGFEEVIQYGMPSYVVPHSVYPDGYHCDPKQPLPFLRIASQKIYVVIYHMGIYVDPKLMNWFTKEYPKHCRLKLDIGKSCVRFKKADQIPYDLVGELVSKMSVDEWINIYELNLKR